MTYHRPAWAEINLDAVFENIISIKGLLRKSTRFMAVIKANAYGHGLLPIAKAAASGGADRLGVALLEEAIELRDGGIELPIQILAEVPKEGAWDIARYRFIPTVYTESFMEALIKTAIDQRVGINVHLKMDTGMNRAGTDVETAVRLYEMASKTGLITVEGVFTHFAEADIPDGGYTKDQLEKFLALKKRLPSIGMWHAANSAAAMFLPVSQLDMVRIGIAMYGLQPSVVRPSPVTLRPALTLKSKVALVKRIKRGEGVSYGLTYRAERDLDIGLVPIGYGDGYSRILSNKSEVLVRGKRLKTIGNICMDQFVIEIPQDVKVAPGEEVTLIGNDGVDVIAAEEIAALLGTINYEVVCMVNKRIPRIYVNK